jgi:hypothetical protein
VRRKNNDWQKSRIRTYLPENQHNQSATDHGLSFCKVGLKPSEIRSVPVSFHFKENILKVSK